MNQEQHYKNIIDDLKIQLSDKCLELANWRSLYNDAHQTLLNQEKNARENIQENRTEEPRVHVVTTKE